MDTQHARGVADNGGHAGRPYRSPYVEDPKVPNHNGSKREPHVDLFEPPMLELGPLVSATSTLRKSQRNIAMGLRLVLVGLPIAFGVLIVAASPNKDGLIGSGFCALIALVVWAATSFDHTCSYVGRDGVSRTTIACSRASPHVTKRLLFRDAAALYTSQIEHFTNGI